MTIALIVHSLGAGGAERVVLTLRENWVKEGHKVDLIILGSRDQTFYPISEVGDVIYLRAKLETRNVIHAVTVNIRRLLLLRKTIRVRHPDVLVSFIDVTNVLVLLSTLGLKLPVIVSERIDPRFYSPGRVWEWLRWFAYRFSTAVVVQTDSVRRWAERFVQTKRVFVIPNLVRPPANVGVEGTLTVQSPFIAAMGRLVHQKGFDLLIEAFSTVADRFPRWKVMIVGEGPNRAKLALLAQKHGLAARVLMPGRIQNPESLLSRASIFVLPSRFEGFPNALLEAMACGLAVIAADCPSGPSEIVRHEVDGILVEPENVLALSTQLARLMANEEHRRQIATAARAVLTRYSSERIQGLWALVLEFAVADKQRLPRGQHRLPTDACCGANEPRG